MSSLETIHFDPPEGSLTGHGYQATGTPVYKNGVLIGVMTSAGFVKAP